MTKIINLKTGRVREHPTKVHSACSLCHCAFVHEDEGGVVGGVIGIVPVNFCPTCFSGLLDMAEYYRSDDDKDA